ncbi:hypothetical protein [Aeromonas hydrophila]|uniref:hypothetical protein n=1 Tax=Aeromonas hydrophila TaxID=644 RepID=UPI003D198CA1
MSWTSGPLVWPATAASLHASAQGVLSQLPASQRAASDRLLALAERAQYRRSPLSEAAEGLAHLRTELDQLLMTGRCLAVTPYQHGVGQRQGNQCSLAAPNAVAALVAKLQDSADPLLPTGQLYAIAWLVTGTGSDELAQLLAPLCALLPLPEWCAALRQLQADNDPMSQPTAAKVPRWRPDEPMIGAPLRPARQLLGSELAQLESLARDDHTPIDKLSALAERRAARLDALEQALAALAQLGGQLWHWHGQGDPQNLATLLGQSTPPDHSMSMTVGALLLSSSPLTFWQELTP